MKILTCLHSARSWLEAFLLTVLVLVLLAALASFGKARITSAIYAERLATAHQALGELRTRYNEAIARTAVTELRVHDGALSVVIRRADGSTVEIPTACDPTREVYVDYLVIDGRLWIRRLFDDSTKPTEATLVDPSLGSVNWDASPSTVGKAIYRRLEEGRWVVTVTGNGALGLERAPRSGAVILPAPPKIRDFDAVMEDVAEAESRISFSDMVRASLAHGMETR